MNLKILPSAFDDLAEGRIFYERQGGKALGDYFFNTLFLTLIPLRSMLELTE